MKKVKYLLWLVIIGVVALAVYQNKGFFMETQSLGINFYFFSYDSPELPIGVYYLAVFLIGILIAYFSALPQKFRSRKTIRRLNEKIKADESKIARLEAEMQAGPRAQRGPAEPREPEEPSEQSQPADLSDTGVSEQQNGIKSGKPS